MQPRYLGDAVYASFDNGMVRLELNRYPHGDNAIYLELQVFEALMNYGCEAFEVTPRVVPIAQQFAPAPAESASSAPAAAMAVEHQGPVLAVSTTKADKA